MKIKWWFELKCRLACVANFAVRFCTPTPAAFVVHLLVSGIACCRKAKHRRCPVAICPDSFCCWDHPQPSKRVSAFLDFVLSERSARALFICLHAFAHGPGSCWPERTRSVQRGGLRALPLHRAPVRATSSPAQTRASFDDSQRFPDAVRVVATAPLPHGRPSKKNVALFVSCLSTGCKLVTTSCCAVIGQLMLLMRLTGMPARSAGNNRARHIWQQVKTGLGRRQTGYESGEGVESRVDESQGGGRGPALLVSYVLPNQCVQKTAVFY